jgi:anaerobic ribonucleoside-triphosphate reductase activating protein
MISTEKTIRIAGIVHDSIVDGPGLRLTIFFQGCKRACEGCHNPKSWDLGGGQETTVEKLLAEIDRDPLISGVTFSGGEPLLRAEALLPLACGIKERRLDLAIYSGFTFEDIMSDGDPSVLELLSFASVLIDGSFKIEKKSMLLNFRGSENQRILDMKKSLNEGIAVLSDSPSWGCGE